ncbi:MAG: DUF1127 domain-containing protein [Pseudorhodoplanes sp.]|jgi:uncharacterized protein YjiS (DUF1127 family)|nr:DUF1127 domain-containing protein [Pseudorhodoplanes sp.]
MLVTTMIHLAPRTIAQARTARAISLGKHVRRGFRRLSRGIVAFRARIALARQYERELALLMQADDRMLSDIGLTRADVVAASRSGWFTPGRMIDDSTTRRGSDRRNAQSRSDVSRLPAPSLTPGAPLLLTVETANFR